MHLAGPPARSVGTEQAWGGARDSAFLTSPQDKLTAG